MFGRRFFFSVRCRGSRYGFIQIAGMFVVVAIEAQQLPVATVRGVVVVIVIAVMDREFVKIRAGEFAAAAPADPGIELERLFPVALLALLSFAPGRSDDTVQPVGIKVMSYLCVTWESESMTPCQ